MPTEYVASDRKQAACKPAKRVYRPLIKTGDGLQAQCRPNGIDAAAGFGIFADDHTPFAVGFA